MNKTVEIHNNAGNTYIGESPEYKVDSAINELLNQLANKPFIFQRARRMPPADVVVKIKHNCIQSKSHIIKQYMDHSATIEAAYNDIDSVVPFGRQIILQNLSDLYFAALDVLGIDYFCDAVDLIKVRENSLFIIDYIIQRLKNSAFESKNTPSLTEQIERGVNVVVAQAFIECVILENPEK
jgi:hypothetical protein